jgi:predicted amidohydrolase
MAAHFLDTKARTGEGSLHQPKQSRIKIAQVKVVPKKGQLESNHRLLMDVLGEIAEVPDVDVVITPEGFLDGYVSTEEKVTANDMVRYAVDLNSSSYVQTVKSWARQQRCWFVLGCTRFENACAYNTAVIINRQGDLVGTYDKLHLQQHDYKYTPGKHLSVYDSDFGLFGVMICADRRWPETVRTLALKGARVILNPTWGMHNDLNLAMMRTRAYESELFIAFTHPEQALITGPEGEVVTNDENPKQRYVVSQLDLSAVDIRRSSSSGHLKDRRPDVYQPNK